jgi:hypothetical protein
MDLRGYAFPPSAGTVAAEGPHDQPRTAEGGVRRRWCLRHSASVATLRPAPRRTDGPRYQACVARQCGQATVVETGARKTKPQEQA